MFQWARCCAAAAIILAAAGCYRKPAAEAMSRGRYLVECVGMCADCHTPRDARGEFDRARWLQGSTMESRPIRPVPGWAEKVPGIAGLPKLGDAAVIRLLETGLRPDGKRPGPPMPQYRLSHEDAAAVADYLKSLPSAARE